MTTSRGVDVYAHHYKDAQPIDLARYSSCNGLACGTRNKIERVTLETMHIIVEESGLI